MVQTPSCQSPEATGLDRIECSSAFVGWRANATTTARSHRLAVAPAARASPQEP